jgi:hypothetical protein
MTWYRSFTGFELIVVSLFIILYLAYIFRMFRIGRVLKVSYRTLILKQLSDLHILRFLLLHFLDPLLEIPRAR